MINISQVNSQVFIKQRKPQCSSLKMRYKERERAWNDRIIKSEQILHLRTKESLNKKRLPKLQNTTAIIVQKYINMQKNQQESIEIVECEQKIVETKLDQLRQLYKVYCIPKIHQNLFNTILEASSNKRAVVEEELNLMNKKLAPIQHCMFVITARENCFKQVFALLKQNQTQIDLILEKLKDLRMLNLTTLESIVKWQQYFLNKNLRAEFQLDDNPPYHQRFCNDYLELKPQLMNLFKVSDWPDPFFIQLLGKGQQRLQIRIRRAEAELLNLILLGEGAFGKAYLVECLQDKSLWVSKYMDLAAMTNQEKDETLREAKILEFLSHPNIVKFREVYKTKKGRLCIVMEYADGGDLSQKIKEAKGKYLPEAQILDWFTQICLAIKHVHDRKIIHRDLKGQNIFLNKEGQVKLGDFGIARILKITLEKAKTMVGTPYYISPEIIEGKPYSVMTDIWSLGVILYELCALQPPFNGDSLHVLAINIVKGQYKPIPANYSKDLKQLVQQMLQVDYRRRPTIQEILKMPVITNRIKSFLSETIQKQEFSHTVFHNKMFEVKGNLNQVNLILNEQPCPPQFLEQNAKNLQEFPEVIKKPSLQDCDIIRPPQIMKQQQQPLSRQSDLQKDAPKIQQQEYQYKKQDIQKQIDVPKKIDPIIKNSPLIQKKDISKDIPQQKEVIKQSPKQQYPIRPKSDQEKQQRSEPCRFDGKVQQKHSNSEQALIPDQKKQQFISPKNKQKLDQPRPPTAPKEQPKLQVAQQRPQSSRPLVSDQKIVQKVNIEQKRRISVDKAPVIQPQQQKQQQLEQQQLEQQRQEEKNRQLKLKQQQEQQEQEKKQKEYQIQQQLLEKQRQLEKQQQLDKQKQQQQQQLEKQKGIEEKQRNIENQLISKMDINRNDQQKQNLQKQPYQKSSQIDNKQFESKQQIKSKADQLQKIEKNAKDFDLMFKELESLINNVHNAIEKFPNQGGKENYFDQNLIQTILIEDREDDEAEPIDQDYKKKKYMVKQISKQEEQCLDILNKQDQNFFSLGIKLENALGQEKMNKAKNIIKQTLEKMNLEKMELQYGPNYEQLLPFLTLEERKKYTQLLFTYILCE